MSESGVEANSLNSIANWIFDVCIKLIQTEGNNHIPLPFL